MMFPDFQQLAKVGQEVGEASSNIAESLSKIAVQLEIANHLAYHHHLMSITTDEACAIEAIGYYEWCWTMIKQRDSNSAKL